MRDDSLQRYHVRGGRAHREAFPAIDIQAIGRAGKNAQIAWEWVNEQGEVVGTGHVKAINRKSISVDYRFTGTPNIEQGEGVFETSVEEVRINPNVLRKFINCPRCSKTLSVVYYVRSEWACGACHNLTSLSQRLGPVNQDVHARDALVAELEGADAERRRTRWYHNQTRRLGRMNRELEAEGVTELPQELRFRTDVRWLAPGLQMNTATDPQSPHAAWTAGDPGGLAMFDRDRPQTLRQEQVTKPANGCTMIGSRFFYRPMDAVLSEWRAQQFETCLRRLAAEPLDGATLMEELTAAIMLTPLTLQAGWTEEREGTSDEGQRELSMTTVWTGEELLWGISPAKWPSGEPFRALLDDRTVTLRARVPGKGDYDPRADIAYERQRLERQIAKIAAVVGRLNAERHQHAERYVAMRIGKFDGFKHWGPIAFGGAEATR